jgi:hypothetical protein
LRWFSHLATSASKVPQADWQTLVPPCNGCGAGCADSWFGQDLPERILKLQGMLYRKILPPVFLGNALQLRALVRRDIKPHHVHSDLQAFSP